MAKFCVHEQHGGVCKNTGTYCNLGACPYEDLKEFTVVRHGKWLEQPDGSTICSSCNKGVTNGNGETVNLSALPFCPKCGAKMEDK